MAIDANFRLVRKEISSEELDPSLSDGWAFFVKTQPYRDYLAAHWAEPQPVRVSQIENDHFGKLMHASRQRSTCVNHEAVNNPDKAVKGKSVSGGGTADCARHNMKRPCGFADLQKGERYAYYNQYMMPVRRRLTYMADILTWTISYSQVLAGAP